MMTLYAACLARLGLSRTEAAALHGARPDTINSWATGRRPVPDGVWDDLRGYEAKIVDRSEAIREGWEDGGEPRSFDVLVNGDPINLMATVDFLLSCDASPPVVITLLD